MQFICSIAAKNNRQLFISRWRWYRVQKHKMARFYHKISLMDPRQRKVPMVFKMGALPLMAGRQQEYICIMDHIFTNSFWIWFPDIIQISAMPISITSVVLLCCHLYYSRFHVNTQQSKRKPLVHFYDSTVMHFMKGLLSTEISLEIKRTHLIDKTNK
jgi:hypothetical protein